MTGEPRQMQETTEVIAETSLLCLYSDGALEPIRLCVSRPSPHPKGDWTCEVSATGLRLWQRRTAIFGISSWHALMLALRLMREILRAELEQGAVLHWPDSTSAITIEELFCQHVIDEPSEDVT